MVWDDCLELLEFALPQRHMYVKFLLEDNLPCWSDTGQLSYKNISTFDAKKNNKTKQVT